jgi:hypothetical protein
MVEANPKASGAASEHINVNVIVPMILSHPFYS